MGQVLSSILRLLRCNWKPDRPKGFRDQSDCDDIKIIIDPPPHVDGGHQQPLPSPLSVVSSDHIHNQATACAHPVLPCNKISKTQRDVTTLEITKTQKDVNTPERVIPCNKITNTQRDVNTSERVIPSNKIAKSQRDVTTSERVIPCNKITKTQRDVNTSEKTKTQKDVNTSERVIPCNKITKTQRDVTTSERVIPSNKITKTQRAISISDVTIAERAVVLKRIGPYTSSQKILLVGEGDFSFSACLAVSFGSATNMIATSLNTQEFLLRNYADFYSNKKKLVIGGCTVLHGIDATQMATHPQLSHLKFDCIVFNFPHSGFGPEDESTSTQTRRHQKLVSGFLGNSKKMIKKNGQIHIRHKCNHFFLQWNIPKLGSDQGLFLIQEANFQLNMFPGYHTKYGFGGDKNFNCNPSKTYMFGLTA